jgi:hypothetical protein
MVVENVAEGNERPPSGAPLIVEILDTTYADAPARRVSRAVGHVEDGESTPLATLELSAVMVSGRDYRIRAHVDVDRDGAVSSGDFITTAVHNAREQTPVRVLVKKV